MTGAEALIDLYARMSVAVCFANPGTTEMALVDALERQPSIRTYLGLFEGVVTGAADGYGRMTGDGPPALTILHLGPGFANGIANLHNARRAGTGIINLVGDHATWHLAADAPLTSDLMGMAATASDWVGRIETPDRTLPLAMDAFRAAMSGQVATIVFPADLQTAEVEPFDGDSSFGGSASVFGLDEAKEALRSEGAALFLGGGALWGEGLAWAGRIAAATGCRLIAETFPARIERGVGRPLVERLPYFPEQATAALTGLAALVVVGAKPPVSFFGYEGVPSSLVPESVEVCEVGHQGPDSAAPDLAQVLERLADLVGADEPVLVPASDRPIPTGPLNPHTLGATIAALQPEGAIVVDEANTSGLPYFFSSVSAPAFDHLTLTGGSLGFGLPAAVGAAIACPDRPVIVFEADGSGMYTLQALWTMVRYQLDVTVVVASNRLYRILRIEAARLGTDTGPVTDSLTDLTGLDWVALAHGHGMPAEAVTTAEALAEAFIRARTEPGPHLIEAVME